MSQDNRAPRMMLNGTSEYALRKKHKDKMAAKVAAYSAQDEQLKAEVKEWGLEDPDLQELGLGSFLKNLFKSDDHPRGADGRFAKKGEKGSIGKALDAVKAGANSVNKQSGNAYNIKIREDWLKGAEADWQKTIDDQQAYVDSLKAQSTAALNKGDYKTAGSVQTKLDDAVRVLRAKQSIPKPTLLDYPQPAKK